MNGTTILTKEKLDKNILIKGVCNVLGIQNKDIMYIEDIDEWANKKNEIVVIEYDGITDDEIANGMHMYDIFSEKKVDTNELQQYVKEKLYDSEEF